MDMGYFEVTADLDAREILRYLNNLGIQNISGEVLKYFITDLKKLIKYDLQQKKDQACCTSKPESVGPERLHSASTFSSRIRSRCRENIPVSCERYCQIPRSHVRDIHSAPVLKERINEYKGNTQPSRKSCSCIRVEKTETELRSKASIPCSNIIKVPKQQPKKKCDPVSLYHYYTTLWAKYKTNVPGENDWSDLRWSVRQKMAGCNPKQTFKKVSNLRLKEDAAKK